jgi:DNA-binding MarR family transcriptional regulator
MPRTGYWITGWLAREGSGLGDLASRLTVSKQAASRLVDVMVRRNYCERISDPTDRRRTTLVLTDRGRSAAAEIRRAVARMNEALGERVDPDGVATTRATLATLVAMGRESRARGAGGAGADR